MHEFNRANKHFKQNAFPFEYLLTRHSQQMWTEFIDMLQSSSLPANPNPTNWHTDDPSKSQLHNYGECRTRLVEFRNSPDDGERKERKGTGGGCSLVVVAPHRYFPKIVNKRMPPTRPIPKQTTLVRFALHSPSLLGGILAESIRNVAEILSLLLHYKL